MTKICILPDPDIFTFDTWKHSTIASGAIMPRAVLLAVSRAMSSPPALAITLFPIGTFILEIGRGGLLSAKAAAASRRGEPEIHCFHFCVVQELACFLRVVSKKLLLCIYCPALLKDARTKTSCTNQHFYPSAQLYRRSRLCWLSSCSDSALS